MFLAIAIAAVVQAPSSLAVGALLVGLAIGAALMHSLIRAGLAVPGYKWKRPNRRAVGWGTTIGVAVAAFVSSAASVVIPGALIVLPVVFAATIAGFFLVLVPHVLRDGAP